MTYAYMLIQMTSNLRITTVLINLLPIFLLPSLFYRTYRCRYCCSHLQGLPDIVQNRKTERQPVCRRQAENRSERATKNKAIRQVKLHKMESCPVETLLLPVLYACLICSLFSLLSSQIQYLSCSCKVTFIRLGEEEVCHIRVMVLKLPALCRYELRGLSNASLPLYQCPHNPPIPLMHFVFWLQDILFMSASPSHVLLFYVTSIGG